MDGFKVRVVAWRVVAWLGAEVMMSRVMVPVYVYVGFLLGLCL